MRESLIRVLAVGDDQNGYVLTRDLRLPASLSERCVHVGLDGSPTEQMVQTDDPIVLSSSKVRLGKHQSVASVDDMI